VKHKEMFQMEAQNLQTPGKGGHQALCHVYFGIEQLM
jgi:hypothetical protein